MPTRTDFDTRQSALQPGSSVSFPNDAHAYLRELGKQLIRLERTEDAARVFALLMALAPQDAFYVRCFGICCERLDRLDEAGEALDRAIAAEPNEPFARTSRAAIRMLRGDRAAALEDVHVAERHAPADSKLARRIAVMKRNLTREQAA